MPDGLRLLRHNPAKRVVHIGAGTGYYTAILSLLVLEGGSVTALEIDEALAKAAIRNLKPFENVTVANANAVQADLPPADIIYVNAGVVAPPLSWVAALLPNGRLIFPWRPSRDIAIAVLATRTAKGYQVRPLSGAWFIPCIGASDEGRTLRQPTSSEAWLSRSIVLTSERQPDESATAIYPDLWFSANSL